MDKLKTNWSEKSEIELLRKQRKDLWKGKSLDFLRVILDLKTCEKIADIGCGMGYLGSILLSECSEQTEYYGIDNNNDLLTIAKEDALLWSNGKKTIFAEGDAYNIPLQDNTFDLTICQTLMMHLGNHEKGLREMMRITKQGGRVVCIEPDNSFNGHSNQVNGFWENIDIKDYAKYIQARLCQYEGKRKLGLGDFSIGNKIPKYMNHIGLTQIEMYNQPQVRQLVLPHNYPIPETANKSNKMKNSYDKNIESEILAGGGTKALMKHFKNIRKKYAKLNEEIRKQYIEGEYYCCDSYAALKISIGVKP